MAENYENVYVSKIKIQQNSLLGSDNKWNNYCAPKWWKSNPNYLERSRWIPQKISTTICLEKNENAP